MKYLFCTDGSKISFDALSKALTLAKNNATVDIIHTIHQNFLLQKLHPEKNFEKKYDEILTKIVKKSQKIIKEHANLEGHKFLIHGKNNKIIEHLEQTPYDLVILGSHGHKGLKNQLGSTSRKVAEKSPYPVFIARPEINAENKPSNNKRKFLICIDESLRTLKAITEFIKILETHNCEISIITVSADITQFPIEISSDTEWISACLDSEKNNAKKVLQKTEELFNKNGLEIKNKIHLEGDIAEEILSYVKKNYQDAIITGSHCRTGIADFLLGSVSKRILDYSTNSILIIPSKT